MSDPWISDGLEGTWASDLMIGNNDAGFWPANSRRLRHCEGCGQETLETWYEPSQNDEGDVDPRANCIDLNCAWGY